MIARNCSKIHFPKELDQISSQKSFEIFCQILDISIASKEIWEHIYIYDDQNSQLLNKLAAKI